MLSAIAIEAMVTRTINAQIAIGRRPSLFAEYKHYKYSIKRVTRPLLAGSVYGAGIGKTPRHGSSRISGRCSDSSQARITVVRILPKEESVITNFAMASSFGAS